MTAASVGRGVDRASPANDVPLHDDDGSALERGLGRRSVALDVGRFAEHDFDGASGHVDQDIVVERPGLQKQHRRPMVFDQAAGHDAAGAACSHYDVVEGIGH
jgi:hypothetical protein